MQRIANTTGTAPYTAGLRFREQIDDEDSSHRDTTVVKFDGALRVGDEDVGRDPYNHTGRFQRLVRG
jgi:hypothetical protein